MDTSKLKPFAQEARRTLRAQVSARLDLVLTDQSAARREQPKAVAELESEIARTDRDQVVERVAYTWFNRFTALRFMDANGYTRLKVVSPSEGQTRPEILAEAAAGNVDDEAPAAVREKVAALLDGRTPSADAQGEAYRLLVVAACNQWHATMPFMFEKIADYTELLLPEDLLSSDSLLGQVRAVMTQEACQDVEIIGWLYQFYISEKKDEVFAGLKKNKKITAENIPAATQLFTPHWIVRYLVENSLGRLWLLNRPGSKLAAKMDYYIAPEEPETDFLRLSKPEDIRICDPACGSGHMLTYAFDLLYAIYEEEGYEATEIPGLILTNNLNGIEIDDRAGALAAFALAMKAATRLGRRRFLRQAVQPNICVLQDVRFTASEMQDVATVVGSDLFTADFRETMGQFEQAKNFGSLIVPKLRDPAEVARVVRLKDFGGDLLLREVQERVLKVLEMAEALSPKFHVVVANPPYMGGKGMNEQLKGFLSTSFRDGKSDLMTAFLQRIQLIGLQKGMLAAVTLDAWMFLGTYATLRHSLLEKSRISSMAYVGWNCFPDGHVYNRGTAFVMENSPSPQVGDYFDLSDVPATVEKGPLFLRRLAAGEKKYTRSSKDFLALPMNPISFSASGSVFSAYANQPSIADIGKACSGLQTGDNDLYLKQWYEVDHAKIAFEQSPENHKIPSGKRWVPHKKGGAFRRWYGNCEYVLDWEDDGYSIKNNPSARPQNIDYWYKPCVTWSHTSSSSFSARISDEGFSFNVEGPSLFTDNPKYFLGLLCSNSAIHLMHVINPTIHYLVGTVSVLPVTFDALPEVVGDTVEQMVKRVRQDWDAYETSWDFSSLPLLSAEYRCETLPVTYSRLRAHWQEMTNELRTEEVKNNRIFIDAYALQGELTPEVPIDEITLTCNPAFRYGVNISGEESEARLLADTVAEFLHYAVGCMFGRYSLDEPGLILANQGEGLADYLARVPNPTFEPDVDNVIPVLDGDWFADDIAERFRKFLRVTFGEAEFQENLAFVEGALGKDIRKWFTRDFNEYHVRRYKKRPIYWMFASPKGSFQALIYMHRYRPDTVSVVLNDYLREYRNKLEAHRKAQEALSISTEATPAQRTKALKEIGEISKVIDELDGYERDVLFPLATQKIEIDLDDGVKANYPKFGVALKPIKGLGDADD